LGKQGVRALSGTEKTVYFPSDPAILAEIIGGNFQLAGNFLFWM